MRFSIIIPVYNSWASLEKLIEEIRQFFLSYGESYEIIMVDDCSGQKTGDVLRLLKNESVALSLNDLQVIHLKKNVGQQSAILVGLINARGEYAVTIDDDLQHDIRDLKDLYKSALFGADLVFGVYSDYGEKKSRELGSKVIGWFFRMKYKNLSGMRVSSYRLIHRSIYNKLVANEGQFVYISAELLPYSRKVTNVIIQRRVRLYGKSGYTLSKCFKIGVKLFLKYGMKPSSVEKGVLKLSEEITHGRRR